MLFRLVEPHLKSPILLADKYGDIQQGIKIIIRELEQIASFRDAVARNESSFCQQSIKYTQLLKLRTTDVDTYCID